MFKRSYDLNRRRDLDVISELVSPGERVLDLGCGDGTFLKQLKGKGAIVQGVELDAEQIWRCIANGVPVIQSDLNGKLDFTDDDSFDWVLLSQTLQEMRHPEKLLQRMVAIGSRVAVSVINFGHWSCRLQVFFQGKVKPFVFSHLCCAFFDLFEDNVFLLSIFQCKVGFAQFIQMIDLFAEQGADKVRIVPAYSFQLPFLQGQPSHLLLQLTVFFPSIGNRGQN